MKIIFNYLPQIKNQNDLISAQPIMHSLSGKKACRHEDGRPYTFIMLRGLTQQLLQFGPDIRISHQRLSDQEGLGTIGL